MTHQPGPRPLLSVVSPMWNEGESADAFLTELTARLDEIDAVDTEILIVDDGSTDATAEVLRAWAQRRPDLTVVSLSRNFGHQAAITAGVFAATGDAVVILDSDLQDPPALIAEMVQSWQAGADVVYAVRRERKGETWFKRSTAALYYRLLRWMSDTDIPADTGDFRLITREVVEALRSMPERDRYMRGMVAWVGFTQVPVFFDRSERHAGRTKYSLGRMVRLATAGVVGFSDKPLYVAIGLGFLVMALAVLGLLYVVLSILFDWGDLVRGWASVVISVMFFSAVQLIFLGVIGIYVSRVFVESKARPLYIVRKPRA
ncbi:MAG: glycosyltransferase family 2 protein [Candidatus Nanopelagicales bacterium]